MTKNKQTNTHVYAQKRDYFDDQPSTYLFVINFCWPHIKHHVRWTTLLQNFKLSKCRSFSQLKIIHISLYGASKQSECLFDIYFVMLLYCKEDEKKTKTKEDSKKIIIKIGFNLVRLSIQYMSNVKYFILKADQCVTLKMLSGKKLNQLCIKIVQNKQTKKWLQQLKTYKKCKVRASWNKKVLFLWK